MRPPLLSMAVFIAWLTITIHGHNIEHLPDWLLVISLDGFRHDYIDLAEQNGFNVSAFRRLQREGVSCKSVIDDFVSKTFPNHYTIATGLHEESHGVLGNSFYDPDLNRVFNIQTNTDSAMWSNGSTNGSGPEPLWVTAQRHRLHSAVINWPSSAAKIKSVFPTYSFGLYSHTEAMHAEYFVERIADWFETDEHCRLGMLYLPEPDSSGHTYGPASKEVLNKVQLLNSHLWFLLHRLESSHHLSGKVNIIVTSDHGMTWLNKTKPVFMDQILHPSLYDTHSSYDFTAWHLWPKKDKEEEVYQTLLNATKFHPFKVLRKGDPWLIRSRYNYNRRIAPISVLANLGSALVPSVNSSEHQQLLSGKRLGDHGYNNSEPDMHPVFLAWGPAFPANKTLDSVRLVDIYPLACRLLDLPAAPHTGGLSRELRGLLLLDEADDDEAGAGRGFFLSTTLVTSFGAFLLAACFTGVFALGAMRAYRTSLYRRNRRFGLLDPSGSANHDSLPLSMDDDDL